MTDTPLHSSLWYRVADLRPQLVARARLHRHRYRGEVWYLLQDLASQRVHRFTPAARLVIAAMNGQRTVHDLWQLAGRHLGEDAPTQDDLIRLLGQLHGADLLMTDVPPDALELFDRGQRETRTKRRRSWANPMSVRIPLWDPGAFLDRFTGLWRLLWGKAGAVAWMGVVLPAVILLPSHWGELTQNLSDRVLQADNLLLIGLLFPLIKALHEMGHATATRAAGGEVHDMGLMLLVLMPVPYVDATSANVLRSRWARARIGAAGMLVEVFIAALAFYLWMLVEPGFLRAVCFNVMLMAGVSALVFNGNPLLRYDAYYILADLAELPNLAAQSSRYWGYLIQRHLLRLRDLTSPARSRSEQWWFGVYGITSAAYRVFVTAAIALFIATQFFFIGVVLAIWSVVSMLVLPIVRGLRSLQDMPQVRENRSRVMGTLAGAVALLVGLVIALPMPYRTQAEGVVWLPEQAIVRAAAPGFFRAFVTAPGTWVEPGMSLTRSVDPALDAQVRLLRARVEELQANYSVEFVADRARADIVRRQLAHETEALARAIDRAQGLNVSAAVAGRFTVAQAADLPGRHLKQGEVIGYLIDKSPPVVRVVLDQASVEAVSASTRSVQIRLASSLDQPHEGRVLRQVPAGREEVPSPALTVSGGGPIAADPTDPKGRRTIERIFEVDVAFADPPPQALPFGQRVHVRFDHPPQPLGVQAWWALRRLFLTHFDV
jgi:putative peptide zinc metalloprotease protein